MTKVSGLFSIFGAMALAAAMLVPAAPAVAGDETRRVAIHVDDNDPKRMNMALNNAENLDKYYKSKGMKIEIRLVAYGPGLHMLRADTSPVKGRIEKMALQYPNRSFAACGNTHMRMSKKSGKDVVLLSEATKVPSGVVELLELQRKGWAYVRP
ncbi:MAG: hypothetical protein ACR2PO_15015 [Methyloligellaceae bacterium]